MIPVHKYFLGEALPAHLSPFVDDTRRVGDYVPPDEQNLLEEEKGEEVVDAEDDDDDGEEEEDESEDDDEEGEEESEEENMELPRFCPVRGEGEREVSLSLFNMRLQGGGLPASRRSGPLLAH